MFLNLIALINFEIPRRNLTCFWNARSVELCRGVLWLLVIHSSSITSSALALKNISSTKHESALKRWLLNENWKWFLQYISGSRTDICMKVRLRALILYFWTIKFSWSKSGDLNHHFALPLDAEKTSKSAKILSIVNSIKKSKICHYTERTFFSQLSKKCACGILTKNSKH